MKRVVYLVVVALVALMISVPAAVAQETTGPEPLPKSGGAQLGSLLLPAGALLIGSGILGYAVLKRRDS